MKLVYVFAWLSMVFLFESCSSSVEYINYFNKNKAVYDSLAQYLLNKYPNDTNKRVMVIVNTDYFSEIHKFQNVDSSILKVMNTLNIEQINLEREGSCEIDCFDKVYFMIHQSGYYAYVFYIYNRCNITGNSDYTSKTIERKKINNRWELLIEKH